MYTLLPQSIHHLDYHLKNNSIHPLLNFRIYPHHQYFHLTHHLYNIFLQSQEHKKLHLGQLINQIVHRVAIQQRHCFHHIFFELNYPKFPLHLYFCKFYTLKYKRFRGAVLLPFSYRIDCVVNCSFIAI